MSEQHMIRQADADDEVAVRSCAEHVEVQRRSEDGFDRVYFEKRLG